MVRYFLIFSWILPLRYMKYHLYDFLAKDSDLITNKVINKVCRRRDIFVTDGTKCKLDSSLKQMDTRSW